MVKPSKMMTNLPKKYASKEKNLSDPYYPNYPLDPKLRSPVCSHSSKGREKVNPDDKGGCLKEAEIETRLSKQVGQIESRRERRFVRTEKSSPIRSKKSETILILKMTF